MKVEGLLTKEKTLESDRCTGNFMHLTFQFSLTTPVKIYSQRPYFGNYLECNKRAQKTRLNATNLQNIILLTSIFTVFNPSNQAKLIKFDQKKIKSPGFQRKFYTLEKFDTIVFQLFHVNNSPRPQILRKTPKYWFQNNRISDSTMDVFNCFSKLS